MPIDARIPMAVQGANAFRPAETLATGTALRQRQDVLDMNRDQFDYERQAAERERTAPIELDIDGLSKTFSTIGQVLSGARNQDDWDQRKEFLRTNINPRHAGALNLGALPEVYTPEIAQEVGLSFQEVTEQLAQKNKERELQAREMTAQAAASGKLGARVNVGGTSIVPEKTQSAFGTQLGKDWAVDYQKMQRAAIEGTKRLTNLRQMSSLLEGVETGTFAPTKLALSKALRGMGFDPEKMSALAGLSDEGQIGRAEAATALANEMALQLRNPAGGAGMPGAMSDKDREFLSSMIAGLATTAEGRRLMLEFQSRIIRRDQEVAGLARQYRQQSPTKEVDDGFYDVLAQKFQVPSTVRAEDLFGDFYDPKNLKTVRTPADLEQIQRGLWFLDENGTPRQRL